MQVRIAHRMEQCEQIIQKCQKNGLSNKAYCEQQGISEKTYYYWLRKLRQLDMRSFRWLMEGLKIDQPKQGSYFKEKHYTFRGDCGIIFS